MQNNIMNTNITGYDILFDFFHHFNIKTFCGVTGGGIIHFLKYIKPYQQNQTSFFNLAEYSAGFVPIGYYLSSGKIAACVATLGAATKLLTCGLSDAKMHDIPAIYIVPAYAEDLDDRTSLQDSSVHGSNAVAQLKAECPNGVFLLDDSSNIADSLILAKQQLDLSKPIVLVLVNSALEKNILSNLPSYLKYNQHVDHKHLIQDFLHKLANSSKDKKITLLVGEEMARDSKAKELIRLLSSKIKPYIVWSMNGANAIDQDNPYSYGYLGFGGNDVANEHFSSINQDHILFVLGACPDEYTMNLHNFSAGHTFFYSEIVDAYGQINHSFQHRANHQYTHLTAPINDFIEELGQNQYFFENIPALLPPKSLNTRKISPPKTNYVDMQIFYQRLDAWWPNNSIGFSDVCLAYKDRQYVTQRPNNNINFYALYRGSAMGNALGLAVGAKLAELTKHVFALTGDGCFKLFSGSLAEAAELGIILFVLNNEKFSIVEQGLKTILCDTAPEYWHAKVKAVDYCLIAKASGWHAEKLNPDLSNLEEILDKQLGKKTSLLIEVVVDSDQILGINPRVKNL